jgi:16S rRNA (uracil1498-N3)-methyltransferase
MPAPRFYCPEKLSSWTTLKLPDGVARHAVKALRLHEGAELCLFDGYGGEYQAQILHIHKQEVVASVGAWLNRETESPCKITLIQALQAADKMDYTLQKAVELGVNAIQPVSSRRSVVRLSGEREQKRLQHWQSIVVSACEQCGRNQVPIVAPVSDLLDWLATPARNGVQRLMLAPGATQFLVTCSQPKDSIELLVGTEGGLDPVEIVTATNAGFTPVVLGPRILRTETAGLAALAAIQTLWGDFQPSCSAQLVL